MNNQTRTIFGEWQKGNTPLSPEEVIQICEKADQRRREVEAYPMDRVYRLLDRMHVFWGDESNPIRESLVKRLGSETGFSPEMLKLGFQELASMLSPDQLRKKIRRELRDLPPYGDPHFEPETSTELRWHPLGTLLHVLSGNVFLVGPSSWLEGVLTRNVNILKMSSSERVFMPAFLESLQACDEEGVLSRSVALIDWDSSQEDVIQTFKTRVDGIVVWGGEAAVQAYRKDLPARTRLICFGPKLSFAVLTQAGLENEGFEEAAQRLASDVSLWDQNACTAPQGCFVEGKETASKFAAHLSKALDHLSRLLPPGDVGTDAAIEIQKWRHIYEIAEARGEGICLSSKGGLDWTVVVDDGNERRHAALEPSPLHRTLRVVPFCDLSSVIEGLLPLRGYLQTAGLLCASHEKEIWVDSLSSLGLHRVTALSKMGCGEIDDSHDGTYDLPQLMNLLTVRLPLSGREGMHPFDVSPPSKRLALIEERLRTLVDCARQSEFYAKRLQGLKIETLADLPKIPLLTREEMDANMPPNGFGLSTRAPASALSQGGYVSRSGGSTGEPKFSLYDTEDWDAMIRNAVPVFRALGLRPGDRLANCMLAGDLYGSFVSFDHVNRLLGVTSFAFGGKAQLEVFVDIARKFKPNAIQGIPGTLMPLLRHAKNLDPSFTIEKVIYAGSPLGETDRQWIVSELGAKRVSSVIGANDGGQIAYQCEEMQGALHHSLDEFNWIEIVDEKGNPVPDGEPGKVILTSLLKFAFPLIRYEIGDSGRIVPGPCACGRQGRRYELLGRSDDILHVGYLQFRYRDAQAALTHLPVSALQIVAQNDTEGETLLCRVETEDRAPQLAERIREALLMKLPKLKQNLDEKSVASLLIEVLPPGALPRNARSGKIKEVVDERK